MKLRISLDKELKEKVPLSGEGLPFAPEKHNPRHSHESPKG